MSARRPSGPGAQRIGWFERFALRRSARVDSRLNIPHVSSGSTPGSVEGATPLVHNLEREAQEMAQHHGLQFEARANSSWRRREELRQLRAVAMDVVAETSDETGSVEQPVAERERRALRRVASIDRELASVNATINSFFTPAQLNAELYFLYVEQKAATYWAVVRRRHLRREAISDIPPTLQRPLWLTAADGTSALEMWNNSERKD